MVLILIAIISLMLFSAVAMSSCFHEAVNVLGFFGLAIGLVSLIIYIFAGSEYFAAEYKAKIINEKFGTKYTQLEVFYAHDVINEIREVDRKRIEINGDLMRESHK